MLFSKSRSLHQVLEWETSRYLGGGHSYKFSVFPFQNVYKGTWNREKSKKVKDTKIHGLSITVSIHHLSWDSVKYMEIYLTMDVFSQILEAQNTLFRTLIFIS